MKYLLLILVFVSQGAYAKTTCKNILGDLHCDDGTMIRKDYFGDIHIQDSHIYRKKDSDDYTPTYRPYTPSSYSGGGGGDIESTKVVFGSVFLAAGILMTLALNGGEGKALGVVTGLFGVSLLIN